MKPLIAIAALVVLATGCGDEELPDDRVESREVVSARIPVPRVRDIDILFTIDNSSSMADDQATLESNLPFFMTALESVEGGMDSLRIGVISTDDSTPTNNGCAQLDDNAFVEDLEDGRGNRTRNYSGPLRDAFSCVARLGTAGSDVSQPLEMARAALAPNAGFLRDEARMIAVVFITDEDDMSPGTVDDYAEFFRSLRPNPANVVVSAVIAQAPRLQEFLDQFPGQSTAVSIGANDYTEALERVVEKFAPPYGAPCLEGNIHTEPLDCTVSDVHDYGTPNATERLIPACDEAETPEMSSQLPCYVIARDTASCVDTPTQLGIQIYPLERRVRDAVTTEVRCAAEPDSP